MDEKYVSIVKSYDIWKNEVTDSIDSYNNGIKDGLEEMCMKSYFLSIFKKCRYFLTSPVGVYNHKTIEAKSVIISDDELNSFVDESIIPYMYIDKGNTKVLRYYKIGE